ncbi:MAG: (d)CMP kinase, partial [Bacteroidia bacterium]|nr:(d)CMP kinase [Bacteroidia bacterium]
MKKINIAIDGYAGCGKSTTARQVAQRLHYVFLDTGSMYRAVTLYFREHQISIEDSVSVHQALQDIHISFHRNPDSHSIETWLNGQNVEKRIRQPDISATVSEISTIKAVREAMVTQQRKIGKNRGVVMDGRDIGTVVFPDAELKVFMTASIEAR